ncbi:hypothetical protein [Methylobacterium sp. WL93]|uniref:hypothetical protein n=1 Tax=Methylobacterium sp. WL93 TaxID=2603892 RepID=UPI001650533D|nr:hypothetical protein [Methylobacterium sp. WL93]
MAEHLRPRPLRDHHEGRETREQVDAAAGRLTDQVDAVAHPPSVPARIGSIHHHTHLSVIFAGKMLPMIVG